MATVAKTKISQLAALSSATATTVIPVSDGTGTITTYKITPDDLIKDTPSLAAKANLAGGNTISGSQDFTGAVNVGLALYAKADMRVDGDIILNKAEQIKFTDNSEFSMSKLYHLNDVTSDIQSQFTGLSQAIALKSNIANPTFTGTVTIPTANVTALTVSSSASIPNGTATSHAVNLGQLNTKANLSGGNTFAGNQVFSGGVDIVGTIDVVGGVISQSYVSANNVDIIQELSMSDGATILYNTNPIAGEKLLNIKNTTSDVQAQINSISGTLSGKSNSSGGNIFSGNQVFEDNILISGTLDVESGITSQGLVSTNTVSVSDSLSLQEGAVIICNANSVPSEKLVHVKNVTFDIQAQLNAKAGLDSPDFDGTPTAITPATTDNSTRIATTQFVDRKIDAKLDRVYAVDDGINPVPAATAPGMNGRLLYDSVVSKLYRSNGADWVQIIPDTSVVYLFVSADCHDFKNKIYIWDGSTMV